MKKPAACHKISPCHVFTKYQENNVTWQAQLHQVLPDHMHRDGYGANAMYFCQKYIT